LITHFCSLIISDSVAVEIFAIGEPCAKIFRKVRCATFLRHGVDCQLPSVTCVYTVVHKNVAVNLCQKLRQTLTDLDNFMLIYTDCLSACREVNIMYVSLH